MPHTKFPKIMGILNITPDSFSDGGDFIDPAEACGHAVRMHQSGADIIDIGGESSRPGASGISLQAEIGRVIPVIERLKKEVPGITISIDTTKYEVAERAIAAGADIINDISGLDADVRLAGLAAEHSKSLILMHKQGAPAEMQNNPQYDDVVEDIYDSLKEKISIA